MAYLRIDDGLDGHPKHVVLSLAAEGLWVRACAYSSRHLTDGNVPRVWVEEKTSRLPRVERQRVLNELAQHRVFYENGTGYMVHDYLDWNPSRAEVLAKRQAEVERRSGRKAA